MWLRGRKVLGEWQMGPLEDIKILPTACQTSPRSCQWASPCALPPIYDCLPVHGPMGSGENELQHVSIHRKSAWVWARVRMQTTWASDNLLENKREAFLAYGLVHFSLHGRHTGLAILPHKAAGSVEDMYSQKIWYSLRILVRLTESTSLPKAVSKDWRKWLKCADANTTWGNMKMKGIWHHQKIMIIL